MNKERLQEIKDSIEFQLAVAKSIGIVDEMLKEENELYDEVVRLNNVINELEKWLVEHIDEYRNMEQDAMFEFGLVLGKLKELKGEKNEKD